MTGNKPVQRKVVSQVERLSYAILGTGALGGLYGGLLARAGCEVHFLLRSDYDHVCQHGLRIESPWGDFHLPQVNAYRHPRDMPPVDVAIVCWKTTDNAALDETLPHIVGLRSSVLVLQNGWDVERAAAEVVGAQRVLGGCCFLCCNKVGPGHIQHLDYGRITFGEYDLANLGIITERMQHINLDFQGAGIEIAPVTDLFNARWRKLMWNIPYNGLSVALDADTSQLMQDPAAKTLVESLMREVRQIAEAWGSTIEEAFIDKLLEDTQRMVPYDSSMRLDYRAQRPLEVEAIFGNPLQAAEKVGYRPAQIEMLYRQLCFLDRQNREATRVAHRDAVA